MWSAILFGLLGCCGQGNDSDQPIDQKIVAKVQSQMETGSLIFSRGDCLAVKICSQSSFTHVGGVVNIEGKPFVYDSMNGIGVRGSPLDEYLRQQGPSVIHVIHPASRFTHEQSNCYDQYLRSQLRRPYSVKHHLTGQRSKGVHCSEYMTDALMAIELISVTNPTKVSPGSLLEQLISTGTYVDGMRIDLTATAEVRPGPVATYWYQRLWNSTQSTCSGGAMMFRRSILCR